MLMKRQSDSYLHIITKYLIPFPYSLADPYPDNSPKPHLKKERKWKNTFNNEVGIRTILFVSSTFFLKIEIEE